MTVYEKYDAAKKELFAHIGFIEKEVGHYPIDDITDCYWQILGDVKGEQHLQFFSSMEDFRNRDGFDGRIFCDLYDPYIYAGKNYTMLFTELKDTELINFVLLDNEKLIDS